MSKPALKLAVFDIITLSQPVCLCVVFPGVKLVDEALTQFTFVCFDNEHIPY